MSHRLFAHAFRSPSGFRIGKQQPAGRRVIHHSRREHNQVMCRRNLPGLRRQVTQLWPVPAEPGAVLPKCLVGCRHVGTPTTVYTKARAETPELSAFRSCPARGWHRGALPVEVQSSAAKVDDLDPLLGHLADAGAGVQETDQPVLSPHREPKVPAVLIERRF